MRVWVRTIAQGGCIYKQAVQVAREVIEEMCLHLMQQNNFGLGCKERAVLVALFLAVGCGGDLSAISFDSAHFDIAREHFEVDWGEKKKGQQSIIIFQPDTKGWKLCFVHGLACYLIMGNGVHNACL